jgi:hypothetical protein
LRETPSRIQILLGAHLGPSTTRQLLSHMRRPPPPFTPLVIFSVCLGEALLRSLHHHRHHTVVLPELITTSLCLLDQDGEDDTELNVCRTRRCRMFGTQSVGARKSSTTSTALNKCFRLQSTRVRRHTLPSHSNASPWIDLV